MFGLQLGVSQSEDDTVRCNCRRRDTVNLKLKALIYFLVLMSPLILGLGYALSHQSGFIVRLPTYYPDIQLREYLVDNVVFPYIYIGELLMMFVFIPLVMVRDLKESASPK